MAQIVGCLAMSHGPQLLTPPDKWRELPVRTKGPFNPKPGIEAELTPETMRAHGGRCDAAIEALRARLAQWAPDTVVIVGDDQGENILNDNMPPFTIFLGSEVDATRRYRYFGQSENDQITHYKVNDGLAEDAVLGLMDSGFDPSWSRETRYHAGLGHAFGRVLSFLMTDANCAIVPVMVNTYYPPAPSARRCFDFGATLAGIIERSAAAERIVVIASGGLSHTVIDEALDQDFMAAVESFDIDYMAGMSNETLTSGTSEIRNWIITAAAAGQGGSMVDYIPCYRTDQGVGCAMGFAYWEKEAA